MNNEEARNKAIEAIRKKRQDPVWVAWDKERRSQGQRNRTPEQLAKRAVKYSETWNNKTEEERQQQVGNMIKKRPWQKMPEELRLKLIASRKGISNSPESIQKAKETFRKNHPNGWKGKNNPNFGKHIWNEEQRKQMSDRGKQYCWLTGQTKETNPKLMEASKKVSKTRKEMFANGTLVKTEEQKEHHRQVMKQKYLDNDFKEKCLKAMMEGHGRFPTSYEKKVIKVIEDNHLPYKYVGDGSFWIGGKNPDFININGNKIAIEVFYDYYKNRDYGSVENYKNIRNNIFNQYGWKIIYLDNNDMRTEHTILTKLQRG